MILCVIELARKGVGDRLKLVFSMQLRGQYLGSTTYKILNVLPKRQMTFDQAEFDIRCEWGEQGVLQLAPISDSVIIVDVMSFSTCVTIAVARGATVFPYRWNDFSSCEFARSIGAELAGSRCTGKYSLSPASLMQIAPGTRLVLPSPNGSTLTLSSGKTTTFAGCFRNSKAVAKAAMRCGPRVAVIPAGERWKEDTTLRPAFEDLLGAGAIIRHLKGTLSPEACLAKKAFLSFQEDLLASLLDCLSGKELRERGYEQDIRLCATLDAEDCAPVLVDGSYRQAEQCLTPDG